MQLKMIRRALALVGRVLGSWNPGAGQGVAPKAPAVSAPGIRLETEYKLAVPAGQDEVVWRWLRTHYAVVKPRALGAGWKSALGEETFSDRYFDVPDGTLLRARAGLRHRQRFDTTGHLTKQLVQLKITDDAGGLLRKELKFKPMGGATATTPLSDLLKPGDRPTLDSALATLGVQLVDVRPAFVLAQRRRRLYLKQDGEDFSTLTLDSSYHGDGAPATFTEIEVEINEKRYTGASETERVRMRVVLDSIRADLFRQFPNLKQDQRPKYQKLAELLAAQPVADAKVIEAGGAAPAPVRAIPWLLTGLGALMGLGIGYAIVQRQRRR